MKRLAALLIGLCFTGCGGSMVLETRTDNVPPPMPAPAPEPEHHRHDVDRQEAVQIAVNAAAQHRVSHASIEKVERNKHTWKVVLWGQDPYGWPVEVRAKVDRRTGRVVDYWSEVEHQKKKHHHDRQHGHDDDDDD